jgi:hypothetical protein
MRRLRRPRRPIRLANVMPAVDADQNEIGPGAVELRRKQ